MDPTCSGSIDDALMGEALAEAETALRELEVPVGCVFVHPERGILGRGHNNTVASCNGTRHAEMEAIDAMLEAGCVPADIAACALYVTVEPCIMCASALRQLGVRRVVFGCVNDKFGGCGGVLNVHTDPVAARCDDAASAVDGIGDTTRLRALPASGGVREAEAVALLRLFYATENQSAPVPQKRTRRQLELAGEAERFVKREGEVRQASAACVEGDQLRPPDG